MVRRQYYPCLYRQGNGLGELVTYTANLGGAGVRTQVLYPRAIVLLTAPSCRCAAAGFCGVS